MPLTWTQLTTTTDPPFDDERVGLGYDPGNDRVIMFTAQIAGGSTTCEFSSGDWTLLSPSGPPPDRVSPGMAWDGVGVLMYGGFGDTNTLRDTWRFTGVDTWTELFASSAPGYREAHQMVWDGTQIVMFGGFDPDTATTYDDTWVWDGSAWTELFPATPPTARRFHMMAYDPATGKLVLFGGTDSGGSFLGDTWIFQAGEWTEVFPVDSPSAREGASFAYDGTAPILFGGNDASPGLLADSWTYRFDNWTECTPTGSSPSARRYATMAPAGDRSFLFGGDLSLGSKSKETWVAEGACADPPTTAGISHRFGLG